MDQTPTTPHSTLDPGTEAKLPNLSEALKAGGVHYGISGGSKGTVFQSMIDALKLPEDVDKAFLLKVLLAREELASTGVGDGIAIPHVRNPALLQIPESMVALCFLEHPVDFAALDSKPVICLFPVISNSVRSHLHLLSRIAYCLRDKQFKQTVLQCSPADVIIREAERVETNIKPRAT